MVRAYTLDLRERVLAVVLNEGMTARVAAARFGISESSAIKWVKRHRQTGAVAPAQIGGYKPLLLAGDLRDWLLARTRSDFTLRGLVAELATRGVKVDYVQVWRFAHAEGLSFKKSVLPAEKLKPKVARRRERRKKFQGRPEPTRLVFVDER